MNARAQITMDQELLQRAQARAAEQGISLAEHVRRLVARDLEARQGGEAAQSSAKSRGRPDVSAIFDLGASAEPTDVAREKDQLVASAVWDEHLRDTRKQGKLKRPTRTSRQ